MINLGSPYMVTFEKYVRLTILLVSEGSYATTASQKVDYTKKSQLYCILKQFGNPISLASWTRSSSIIKPGTHPQPS